MSKIQKKSPFANIHHVGAIVRDADKAAKYYESLGMGLFEPLVVNSEEDRIRGKLIRDLKLNVRMAHIGPIRFELLEPVSGTDSIWKEVLENRGECIHHIAFVVDDIEEAKEQLAAKGLNLIFDSNFKNGGGAAYFETGNTKGIVIEIFQRPRDYVAHE